MKILITIHDFDQIRGQQKFAYELCEQWINDDITIYSPSIGKIADISELRVQKVWEELDKEYDFILMFHYFPELEHIKGYKVYYCNDSNANFDAFKGYKVNKFACISEEIEENFGKRNIPVKVIRNGIDCEYYSPVNNIGKNLERILLMNYLDGKSLSLLQYVCRGNGIELDDNFGKWENRKWHVKREIQKADLVISVGRGAYEAMACGREVLIWGIYGFDGMVGNNFDELLFNNCSGRRYNKEMKNGDELLAKLEKYNCNNGIKNRKRIEDKLNIKNVAEAVRCLHPNLE